MISDLNVLPFLMPFYRFPFCDPKYKRDGVLLLLIIGKLLFDLQNYYSYFFFNLRTPLSLQKKNEFFFLSFFFFFFFFFGGGGGGGLYSFP